MSCSVFSPRDLLLNSVMFFKQKISNKHRHTLYAQVANKKLSIKYAKEVVLSRVYKIQPE